MSILSQNNPFRFFLDKRARQWERTPDNVESMAYYPSGLMPSFQVIVDKIVIVDSRYNWRLKMYDSLDNEITAIEEIYPTYGGHEGGYTLTFTGAITEAFGAGYYYYKLFNDVEEYYSDVFGYIYDEDDLLKFEVDIAPVRLGGNVTLFMSESFNHKFYLSAESLGIKPKTDADGNMTNGINVLDFGTRVISHDFEIDASESIYMYLSTLDILQVNGSVKISWQYLDYNATDFLIEETTNHNQGLYQLKFSFVDESETISAVNG